MALNDTPSWVNGRLSSLDVPADWQPETGAALGRLTARRSGQRARTVVWTWRVAMAAGVLALLAATPPMRVAAQRAWEVLFARDVSVLRIDMDAVPAAVWDALQTPVTTNGISHRSVASADEAARIAGFTVAQVPEGLMPATPAWSVVSPVSGELVLRVDALEKAAQVTGARDVVVPPDWDGARIRVETASLVLSAYGETMLMQTRPIAIAVPPGFDMPSFVAVALRLLGFDAAQASMLSQKTAVAPVAFLGIPRGERVQISEVPLGSGTGTLIRDLDGGDLTVIWSSVDRLYVLTGPIADDAAFAVANALEHQRRR